MFFSAIAALAFMVITTIVIEIRDLDDRQFQSKNLARLHRAANALGNAGMIAMLLLLLNDEHIRAMDVAFTAMFVGFISESILDILRVRTGSAAKEISDGADLSHDFTKNLTER